MRKIETLRELYDYATVTYAGNRLSKTVDAELEYSYRSFRDKCEELSGVLADAGVNIHIVENIGRQMLFDDFYNC